MMTVDAIVPLSGSPSGIPVPVHATMSTMLIIPQLRTVALSAQGHHVGKLHGPTVGEFQGVVIVFVMTGQTRQFAVGHGKPGMELVQLLRGIGLFLRKPGLMASTAGHGHRFSGIR